ncbi:MAG TPA: AAA family ATPase, partial [Chloroflexota bacterium]|nr:AAA family ATPase [Chloroflexota bacterium]
MTPSRSADFKSRGSFGALLRGMRLSAGLSQEALAERAHMSVRGLSDLERGVRHTPYPDTLARLVEALGLDAAQRERLVAAAGNQPELQSSSPRFPRGGFLGAVPEHPLIGRERALARVLRAIEDASAGRGRLILLTGEPGIGKTRLAQEAVLEADRRGFLILIGRCHEQHQWAPLEPFVDVFARAGDVASEPLSACIATHWPTLQRWLAEGTLRDDPRGESADQRVRLQRECAGFLGALSSEAPLALFLDDLQWADSLSLALLEHLAHSLAARPVLLLGTYRDVEVGRQHLLHPVIRDLVRDRLLELISLAPLSLHATAQLIRSRLGDESAIDELATLLHRRTQGNPFFTEEIMQASIESAVPEQNFIARTRSLAQLRIPESIRAVILQRVDRLPAAAQQMLSVASVLGQEFDLDVLRATADFAEPTVLAALDAALGSHLIESRRAGMRERFGFSHALIQETLYGELPPHRARRLHHRAGEVLESVGDVQSHSDLARHFLAAGDGARGAAFAEQEGDRASSLSAYVEAAQHYRSAANVLLELSDDAAAARLQRKLGDVLNSLDRRLGHAADDPESGTLEAYTAALHLYERLNDRAAQADVERRLAWVHQFRRNFRAAMPHLEAAMRLWPRQRHDAPYVELLLDTARARAYVTGEHAAAEALARQALQLAERLRDAALEVRALVEIQLIASFG